MPYSNDPANRVTPRILIVAGSDSGGGAGIQADIKTVSSLGGHAMTAVTAITAQNTVGVQAVMAVPTSMVVAQMRSCIDDIGVDAIKIGMIGSAETARAVTEVLVDMKVPVVFDPVMVATSGDSLADLATIAAFERLVAVATVTTPNLPELEALGGLDRLIPLLTSNNFLLQKGGHAVGPQLHDILFDRLGEVTGWLADRIDTTSTHGTGCTLASAIAVELARGSCIIDAVTSAREFVRASLERAPGLGQGHGPMGQQFTNECRSFGG